MKKESQKNRALDFFMTQTLFEMLLQKKGEGCNFVVKNFHKKFGIYSKGNWRIRDSFILEYALQLSWPLIWKVRSYFFSKIKEVKNVTDSTAKLHIVYVIIFFFQNA